MRQNQHFSFCIASFRLLPITFVSKPSITLPGELGSLANATHFIVHRHANTHSYIYCIYIYTHTDVLTHSENGQFFPSLFFVHTLTVQFIGFLMHTCLRFAAAAPTSEIFVSLVKVLLHIRSFVGNITILLAHNTFLILVSFCSYLLSLLLVSIESFSLQKKLGQHISDIAFKALARV